MGSSVKCGSMFGFGRCTGLQKTVGDGHEQVPSAFGGFADGPERVVEQILGSGSWRVFSCFAGIEDGAAGIEKGESGVPGQQIEPFCDIAALRSHARNQKGRFGKRLEHGRGGPGLGGADDHADVGAWTQVAQIRCDVLAEHPPVVQCPKQVLRSTRIGSQSQHIRRVALFGKERFEGFQAHERVERDRIASESVEQRSGVLLRGMSDVAPLGGKDDDPVGRNPRCELFERVPSPVSKRFEVGGVEFVGRREVVGALHHFEAERKHPLGRISTGQAVWEALRDGIQPDAENRPGGLDRTAEFLAVTQWN